MTRSSFLTWSVVCVIFFIFFKIYQHNKFIKLMYQKQRIEKSKARLEDENNRLLVELYTLKDQARIKTIAHEKLGMQEARLSQFVIDECATSKIQH